MKSKNVLGRGLDALINPNYETSKDSAVTIASSDINEDDGKSYNILAKLSIDKIKPNPFQPRIEFEQTALDELKKSILENGLIQPVTVRRAESSGYYELVSGERRFRACKDIGFEFIPAYIIKAETKEIMLALSLIENIQREKLNPIEIGIAYKKLYEECNLSHEEIANKVGKDRSTVVNFIRLLKLPKEIQEGLIQNKISMGHARVLINLPSQKIQMKLFNKIIDEGLSVRAIENIIQKMNSQKVKITKSSNNDSVINDYESKLRSMFATKVKIINKKSGSGQIVFEYYSPEEFERLYEIFESSLHQ